MAIGKRFKEQILYMKDLCKYIWSRNHRLQLRRRKTGFLYCKDVNYWWLYKSKRLWETQLGKWFRTWLGDQIRMPSALFCSFLCNTMLVTVEIQALCNLFLHLSQLFVHIFICIFPRLRLVIPQYQSDGERAQMQNSRGNITAHHSCLKRFIKWSKPEPTTNVMQT